MASRMPWFRMHQDDWLAHARLRRCSVEARGVWIDLVCMMRQEESGTLEDDLDGMARSIGLPVERLLANLEELSRRNVAGVSITAGRVSVTSRRVTRDLEDEERERAGSTHRSREHRSRNADATPMQRSCNADATPMQRSCNADATLESQSQSQKKRETSSLRSDVSAAPLAAHGSLPAPPAEPKTDPQPVPPDLAPLERWHRDDAVPQLQLTAQRHFVAAWPQLVADLTRAHPHLDVLAEAAKAYAWETANPARRKTPRGRGAFLASWLGRAQDHGGASRGTGPPPVIGRTLQQREEDRAEEISLARFGQRPLRTFGQAAPAVTPLAALLPGGPPK